MRAGFLNVNSIRAYIGKIRQFLIRDQSSHLFGVAETSLGPIVDDSLIQVAGYSLIRQDRNVNVGGVAPYVRNTFKLKISDKSITIVRGKPRIPEYIMCSEQEDDLPPVLVAVIYRPPKIPFYDDPSAMNAFRDLCEEYSHKIMMGDLNEDLAINCEDAGTVRRLADDLSLQIVQQGSYHITTSRTWIDMILVDGNDTILDQNNNSMTYRNEHNIIDVTINYQTCIPPVADLFYRKCNDINTEPLIDLLQNCE